MSASKLTKPKLREINVVNDHNYSSGQVCIVYRPYDNIARCGQDQSGCSRRRVASSVCQR